MSPRTGLSWCFPVISSVRAPDSFVPTLLQSALYGLAANEGFSRATADKLWDRLRQAESRIRNHCEKLSSSERQSIRQKFTAQGGFGLQDFPSFSDVTEHFPLPDNPLPPVEFPFPPIDIPVEGAISAPAVTQVVADKITGLGADAFQTVKEIVVDLPAEALTVAQKFTERISAVGVLLKEGVVDQAIGEVFESVILLARDLGAVAFATVTNVVVDVFAGVIGGLFLARGLTSGEKEFAHEIFHGQVNLTHVRVAIFPNSPGLTSANVIYMPDMDLRKPFVRGRFAHELTHVYQDQQISDPGTLRAAEEFLNHHYGSGKQRYKYEVEASTTWNDFGVEQQGQIVEDYQKHLDVVNGLADADSDDEIDSTTTLPDGRTLLDRYENLLHDEGLF